MSEGLSPATMSAQRAIDLMTGADGAQLAARHISALSHLARQYQQGLPESEAQKLAALLDITRKAIQRGRQDFVDPCCCLLRRVASTPYHHLRNSGRVIRQTHGSLQCGSQLLCTCICLYYVVDGHLKSVSV
jgi:hypothetical protein